MNLKTFTLVLQCSLFHIKGYSEDYMINLKIDPEIIKVGIKLSQYLQKKEIRLSEARK